MFSEKQEKLFDHLLSSLGFETGEYREKYKFLLSEFISRKGISKFFTYTNSTTGKLRSIDVGYNAIDALFEEISFRKEQNWSLKKTFKTTENFVTASDLAAYTFCPASYAILNTFNVETSANMETGTEQHAKFKLLRLGNSFQLGGDQTLEKPIYEDATNTSFFMEIRKSTLIHSGHTEENNNHFNIEEKFCGNPDYVFEHPETGRFIIEEKFRNDNQGHIAFENHKVQLAAYIYKLKTFNAQYGYLLYWNYDRLGNDIIIEKCKVYKINKSNATESFVNSILDKVIKLNTEQNETFDPAFLNPNKCVNCSVNKWCGHKSGRYKELELPYATRYLDRFYSKYESDL